MELEIFKNIITNVGLIVLFSYLLLRIQFAQNFIVNEKKSLKDKLIMSIVFGLIGIASTYTGINVNGAIANTRVIGVVAGGILGGPIVGIVAGLIAGVHRLMIDIGGFTALACCIATIAEGAIGGAFSDFIKRQDNDYTAIFMTTVLAEIVQMAIILLVAKPFSAAWALVEMIAVPMILFNSIGVTILLNIVNSVVIEQNHHAAKRIQNVISIADECLPYLRQGLYDLPNVEAAIQIILKQSDALGVVVTDKKEILAKRGNVLKKMKSEGGLPLIAYKIMATKATHTYEMSDHEDHFHEILKMHTVVGAPLTQNGEVIGTLLLVIGKFKLSKEVDAGFVSGLAKLFSTQLELSQVEIQTKLRQKAEFLALQSQINPHFLFNSLSTITAFIREKPDRARELLIVLSNYFRNTLQDNNPMISLADELNHVNQYLTLEKARFDEKLQIEVDLPEDIDCTMPSFILQPIVENAVKHGAMSGKGVGYVNISAWQSDDNTMISVRDNGSGMPPHVVYNLNHGLAGSTVGLFNVQKRLTTLYGEDHRLLIWSTKDGTEITIRIPHNRNNQEVLS